MSAGTKSVLIIGGNSFLGVHLAYRLRDDYRVVSASFDSELVPVKNVLSVRLNFKDENFTKQLIFKTAPEFVIYLGGSHVTAWAEKEAKIAELFHANGIGEILKSTELLHSKFLYLSSCFVFDGHRGNYKELDTLSPFMNLGRFKASGENFVRSRASNYSILRVPPLYGRGHPYRPGFLDRLHKKLSLSQAVELQDYELYNFASARQTTETIKTMLGQGLKKGIYHYGGLTRLTHYGIGVLYARAFGLNEKLITPIERPYVNSLVDSQHRLDFSMNCTEILKTYPVKTFEVEETLKLDPFFI
jgi:dTDP-4-dehydrorhamnose reductase